MFDVCDLCGKEEAYEGQFTVDSENNCYCPDCIQDTTLDSEE